MGNKQSSRTIEEQLIHSCSQSNGTASLRRLLSREDLPENFLNLRVREGGHNLLALACRAGCLGSVRLLLDRGAKVSERSDNGETVLHNAVEGGSVEVVDLLLEKGADPTAMNLAGENVIDLAQWKESSGILRAMERRISYFSGAVVQEHSTKLQSGVGLLMGQDLKETMISNFGGELKKRWLVVTKVRGTMQMATRGQIVCPRCETLLREPSPSATRLICTCRHVFRVPPRRPGVVNALSIYKSSHSARPLGVYPLKGAEVRYIKRNNGQNIVNITVMVPSDQSHGAVVNASRLADIIPDVGAKKTLRFVAPSEVVAGYLCQAISKPLVQVGHDEVVGSAVPVAVPVDNQPDWPNTGANLPVATVSTENQEASESNSPTNSIACPHCTFLNARSRSNCEMCELELGTAGTSAPFTSAENFSDSGNGSMPFVPPLQDELSKEPAVPINGPNLAQHTADAVVPKPTPRRTRSTPDAGRNMDEEVVASEVVAVNDSTDNLPKAPPLPPRPLVIQRRRSTGSSLVPLADTELNGQVPSTEGSAADLDTDRRQSMPASFLRGVEEEEEELEAFLCPITSETMKDPVLTVDGMTYERQAIEDWFSRGNQTSPMTGAPLASTMLTPNIALRQAIEQQRNSTSLRQRQSLGGPGGEP